MRRLRPLLLVVAPSLLGVLLDIVLRGGELVELSRTAKTGYAIHFAVQVAIWSFFVWCLARFERARRYVLLLLIPLVACCYGVQLVYFRIFKSYITHQTLSVGFALRSGMGEWWSAWGPGVVVSFILAAAACIGFLQLVKREPDIGRARPIAPATAFVAAVLALATDVLPKVWVEPPDSAFTSALVTFTRDLVLGRPRAGVSTRVGVTLPNVTVAHKRNVILIITESVRADALCAKPCALDVVLPERISLKRLTAQSSGTLTSCMTFWTGLGPEADVHAAHSAPLLWERARAAGYRTLYISAQDMRSIEMGPFLKNAGIDEKWVGEDLGSRAGKMHIGAPDENATAKMLELAKATTEPYFAVLHLANTHFPYRTEQPGEIKTGEPEQLRARYLDAVALQERTIASFYSALKTTLPSWNQTVTLFVSDHGEQFREHGSLFHLNSLYETEIRIPGWVAGGGLSPDETTAIATYTDKRVFSEDIHATALDALGLPTIHRGRSLLHPYSEPEPMVTLSTVSGVWTFDAPTDGVMQGEKKALRPKNGAWQCFDLTRDPDEKAPAPASDCASLIELGNARFTRSK